MTSQGLDRRAAELRQAFDQAFVDPPKAPVEGLEDLLVLRVREDAYAVRASQVVGLHRDSPLSRLSSAWPDFVGLTGVRGQLIPVFDLGMLLGYQKSAASRWLLLGADSPQLGLLFDAFDAHLRLPASGIAAAGEAGRGRRFCPDVVELDGVRPIIHLPSLREVLVERAGKTNLDKEH